MMEIDLKHLAKCLRNDGNPDFTYIGQHFGETPGWGCLADEVLRLTARIAALVKRLEEALNWYAEDTSSPGSAPAPPSPPWRPSHE